MHIAFIFIAEAYQCYHGASVAFALGKQPGVDVSIYYIDPETPYHLDRIRNAYGAPPMAYFRLKRNLFTRILQAMKIFGFCKPFVLRTNESHLATYDAVFSVEKTVFNLFEGIREAKRPAKIYLPHGFGDRAESFSPKIAKFDFVILAGQKTATRMLELGLIRPDNYALSGTVKLETAEMLRRAHGSFFAQEKPTILYNAHKAPGLESWSRFIEPMLADFASQDDYNLIVAPHVKMFRRKSKELRSRWNARSTHNVLIDTGSDFSVDMSYARASDIYLGDVSSQVYEFLSEPRPCIFLNAHKIDWRDDPNFAHWHLGDVIDQPEDLMPAIRAAPERHHLYRDKQAAMASASLGDCSPGATDRVVAGTLGFLRSRFAIEPTKPESSDEVAVR